MNAPKSNIDAIAREVSHQITSLTGVHVPLQATAAIEAGLKQLAEAILQQTREEIAKAIQEARLRDNKTV